MNDDVIPDTAGLLSLPGSTQTSALGASLGHAMNVSKALEREVQDVRLWESTKQAFLNDMLMSSTLRQSIQDAALAPHRQQMDFALRQARESSWASELAGAAVLVTQLGEAWANSLELVAGFAFPAVLFPTTFDLEAYREREGRSLAAAASLGWFIQPEMSLTIGANIDLAAEEPEEVQALFEYGLNAYLKDIELRVTSDFPDLAHMVKEAFNLHRENRYVASVPLFFVCADGIAKAITNKSVFTSSRDLSGTRKGSQVSDWVRQHTITDGMTKWFEVLCARHSLSYHSEGKLNRHKVLHGEDTQYGSEANSLRAISFLGFVGWLLKPNAGHLQPKMTRLHLTAPCLSH